MNRIMVKVKKNQWENILCFLVFYTFILLSSNSFAADSLSYSGRLVKADGAPVSGPVNLKVDLAYTDFPNTILCSQNFSSVVLSNGVFHLKLDLVCPGPPAKTVTEILSAVPVNFAAALRVSDVSNNKIYAFQEIHSIPFATVSESAKQLAQLGAVNGEVLKWNETNKKWEPSAAGAGGTVTNVTASAPLAVASGATTPAVSISQATTSTDGYLSAIDWNNFNNKIGVVSGGTVTQFYRGDKSWQTLNTDAVPELTNLYFTNARVLGVPLDGFIAGPGAIVATDTVLQAFAKTQGQINSLSADSAKYLIKNGTDIITGAVSVGATGSLKITNAPAMLTDVTNMAYVDSRDDFKVSKIGDTMSGVLTLDSDLKIKSGTTSNYVTLKGHATSDNYNLFLPSTDGNPGEVLKTDGAGNLSWINPSTVAAGSATVDSAAIMNGTIVDADIANTTISYAKLNLTDGDIPLVKLNGVSDATKYLRADKSWQTLNGAAVANTPAGSIAATSTQAALNELDSEKEATVTAGLATDYYKGNKTWSNLGTDVRASQLTGLAAGTNTALVATDSILTAFQNTQAQINNKQNAISKSTDQDLKSVRLYGANATNYVELTAGALTANRSLIFPDANGSSGQVLTTNGAGVLSWTTAATTGSAVGGDLSGTIANAQLGAGVVGNTELAADAVTSAKILDGTIVNADLADTTITYAKLNLTDGDIPLAKLNGASDTNKYLRGDKSWSTFATDAIASALSGFTPFATKTDITAADSIFTAFRKTQKQLDDIDGDYVSKSGNNTVTGTFNISGITAFLNIPTPTGTTLSEAANVDYVKTYVGSMGQWTKGTGGNASDIYFSTGKVGIGTNTPGEKLDVYSGAIRSLRNSAQYISLSGGDATNQHHYVQGMSTEGNKKTMFLQSFNDASGAAAGANGFTFQTGTIAAPVNVMTILEGGNVGIGTNTPLSKLNVIGARQSATIKNTIATFDNQAFGIDVGAGLGFGGAVNAGGSLGHFALIGGRKENAVTDDLSGYLVLETRPLAGNLTERVRVTSTGNVGIGTTAPTEALHILRNDGVASGEHWLFRAEKSAAEGGVVIGYQADGTNFVSAKVRSSSGADLVFGTSAFANLLTLKNDGTANFRGNNISRYNPAMGLQLGDQDWSDMILTPPASVAYSSADKGMKTTGDTWFMINTRVPIDPKGVYRVTVRMKKIDGTGTFYVGADSLDANFTTIKTDSENSYNYFAAENYNVAAGSTYTASATISGHNIVGGAGDNKFDPNAKYFNVVIITNYMGTGNSVIEAVEVHKIPTLEPWKAAVLENSWVYFGSGYSPPAYFKDNNGIVHLRGLIAGGTFNTCAFTLPVDYRPAYRILHSTQTNPDTIGRLDVTAAGCVNPIAGSNLWFSLDGVTFRTD